MDRGLIRDYLLRAEMNDVQSEALSRILAEMATKNDLLVLQEKVEGQMALLRADMGQLRAELTGEMARQMAAQTRWMIALIAFFGTVITMLNVFTA